MTEMMQAALLYQPADIRVEQFPKPTVKPRHALLKVAAVGVCGSDMPRMMVKGAHNMPLICGHEFSGEIIEIGEGITDFSVGDIVTVPPMIPCFQCEQCLKGNYSMCVDYDYFGSRRHGAYAEYVNVPYTNLLKIPDGLNPIAAAMVDPAAIALHALWRANLRAGQRVAVVGCGPIGLFAIQWARISGASDILAVDIDQKKIDMAVEAGATIGALTAEDALSTGYFDVVFEVAGHPSTPNLVVKLVASGGTALFIGIPNAPITLEQKTYEHFLRQEVAMKGVWNSFSAPFPGDEWRTTLAKMASGDLKWEFMVTHRLQLDLLPNMLAKMIERDEFASKVIFQP